MTPEEYARTMTEKLLDNIASGEGWSAAAFVREVIAHTCNEVLEEAARVAACAPVGRHPCAIAGDIRALKSQPAEPAPTFEALVSRAGPLPTTGLASAEPCSIGAWADAEFVHPIARPCHPVATLASPAGGAATGVAKLFGAAPDLPDPDAPVPAVPLEVEALKEIRDSETLPSGALRTIAREAVAAFEASVRTTGERPEFAMARALRRIEGMVPPKDIRDLEQWRVIAMNMATVAAGALTEYAERHLSSQGSGR